LILGVHPAELTKYYGRLDLRLCGNNERGLEIAAAMLLKKSIGLKSGRPHYEVEPKIWEFQINHALLL